MIQAKVWYLDQPLGHRPPFPTGDQVAPSEARVCPEHCEGELGTD